MLFIESEPFKKSAGIVRSQEVVAALAVAPFNHYSIQQTHQFGYNCLDSAFNIVRQIIAVFTKFDD